MTSSEKPGAAIVSAGDIEWKRFQIEEAKFELEKERADAEKRLFRRHAPELIAAAIALAGVLVSGASVWATSIQKDRELEQQKIIERGRRDLQKAEDDQHDRADSRNYDYKWKLDMMQFLERHGDDLCSDDPTRIARIQAMMLAAFPPDYVTEAFLRLKSCPNSAKKAWVDAPKPLPVLSAARVTFQTTNDNKDEDTAVTASIVCQGRTIALVSGTWGRWDNGAVRGPFDMRLLERPTASQIDGSCQAVVVEAPNGHDEWHFNWSIDLAFSDGGSRHYDFQGGNVDYDRATTARPF